VVVRQLRLSFHKYGSGPHAGLVQRVSCYICDHMTRQPPPKVPMPRKYPFPIAYPEATQPPCKCMPSCSLPPTADTYGPATMQAAPPPPYNADGTRTHPLLSYYSPLTYSSSSSSSSITISIALPWHNQHSPLSSTPHNRRKHSAIAYHMAPACSAACSPPPLPRWNWKGRRWQRRRRGRGWSARVYFEWCSGA